MANSTITILVAKHWTLVKSSYGTIPEIRNLMDIPNNYTAYDDPQTRQLPRRPALCLGDSGNQLAKPMDLFGAEAEEICWWGE